MISINPESINDLLALKEMGIPITLTSHPGNASLYKLVLWSCGIPEHLWDITCCKADANNWPMHRLIGREAELLVSESLHRDILEKTRADNRYVTAYQVTKEGVRLGRVHTKAMQVCFPEAISSQSRLLLSEKERLHDLFDYLARTKGEEVFTRFITPEGISRPVSESGIEAKSMADSFIQVLQELDHLLFSDEAIVTKGGACYGGVMVPLSAMLVQYWQSGRVDRYDISGPDMIHYATSAKHKEEISEMLRHVRKWNPKLIPQHLVTHILPGTVARVGHLEDHPSEAVMRRKIAVLTRGESQSSEEKRSACEVAQDDERLWPTHIRPSKDRYFSQHDLAAIGKKLVVDPMWKDVPFSRMRDVLSKANSMLRIKSS